VGKGEAGTKGKKLAAIQQREIPCFDRPVPTVRPRWFGGYTSLSGDRGSAMGGRTVMAVSKNSSALSLNRRSERRQRLRAGFSGWHKRRFTSLRVGRLERPLNNGYKGDERHCSSRGNAHAHKTKRSSEEIGSDTENEGGWREDSQDEEVEGGRYESCEYERAESSSLEGGSDQETTGCCRRITSCPNRSATCRNRSTAHHGERISLGILRPGRCR
jgi:hypothetical protein